MDFLVDFLQSSELIVTNEFAIWNGVRLWLVHESRIHQLRENAARLLPLIRFPQMLVPQIFQLEKSELASNPECGELLHELLSKAYRFRSLCPIQGSLGVSFNEPFYLPRDYVDLIVDTVRIQSTLRFGIQVCVYPQCIATTTISATILGLCCNFIDDWSPVSRALLLTPT